jgi:hypothetical protein
LSPQQGTVVTSGDFGYLPQDLTLATHLTVADLLGISGTLQAIAALESGDASPEVFDAIGDDWEPGHGLRRPA